MKTHTYNTLTAEQGHTLRNLQDRDFVQNVAFEKSQLALHCFGLCII